MRHSRFLNHNVIWDTNVCTSVYNLRMKSWWKLSFDIEHSQNASPNPLRFEFHNILTAQVDPGIVNPVLKRRENTAWRSETSCPNHTVNQQQNQALQSWPLNNQGVNLHTQLGSQPSAPMGSANHALFRTLLFPIENYPYPNWTRAAQTHTAHGPTDFPQHHLCCHRNTKAERRQLWQQQWQSRQASTGWGLPGCQALGGTLCKWPHSSLRASG